MRDIHERFCKLSAAHQYNVVGYFLGGISMEEGGFTNSPKRPDYEHAKYALDRFEESLNRKENQPTEEEEEEAMVETTDQMNETYRTYEISDERFKNGKEAYNRLSPLPEKSIDLGDGRILKVQEWNTFSGKPEVIGFVKVEIKGIICLKKDAVK